jgi:hypothetical protein
LVPKTKRQKQQEKKKGKNSLVKSKKACLLDQSLVQC